MPKPKFQMTLDTPARTSSYKHHGKGRAVLGPAQEGRIRQGALSSSSRPFQVMSFNNLKLHYRGLEKNPAQLLNLFGVAWPCKPRGTCSKRLDTSARKTGGAPQISENEAETGQE